MPMSETRTSAVQCRSCSRPSAAEPATRTSAPYDAEALQRSVARSVRLRADRRMSALELARRPREPHPRQLDREGGTLILAGAFRDDRAPVQLDDVPDDGEPEPETGMGARGTAI